MGAMLGDVVGVGSTCRVRIATSSAPGSRVMRKMSTEYPGCETPGEARNRFVKWCCLDCAKHHRRTRKESSKSTKFRQAWHGPLPTPPSRARRLVSVVKPHQSRCNIQYILESSSCQYLDYSRIPIAKWFATYPTHPQPYAKHHEITKSSCKEERKP